MGVRRWARLIVALVLCRGDEVDHTESCVSIGGEVRCGTGGHSEWVVQFGSSRNDELRGLSVDASTGRLYAGGVTQGSVGGEHRGFTDVWLAGISAAGEHEWSTQIGTKKADEIAGVAAGAGDVVGAGLTFGSWGPQGNAGMMDAWRGRWDSRGRGIWGTHHDDGGEGVLQSGSSKKDSFTGVACDAMLSVVYAAGQTYGHVDDHHENDGADDHDHKRIGASDAFVAAYDGGDGALRWAKHFGSTKSDSVAAVATSASGDAVYVCGSTFGVIASDAHLGRGDAFVTKLDGHTGETLWTVQLGSEKSDEAFALATTASGDAVFVAGSTFGDEVKTQYSPYLPPEPKPGGRDGFVVKLHGANGNLAWSKILGTDRVDELRAVAVSALGDAVYVGGQTYGALGDGCSAVAGKSDAWIAKLDGRTGARSWTSQFGETGRDSVDALAVASNGDLCAGGSTDGSFGGCSAGLLDVWVSRVSAERAFDFYTGLDKTHAATLDCKPFVKQRSA